MITTSAFQIAQRFIGTKEVKGIASNPMILAMLHLDETWPEGDETAWCSAFANYIAWLLRLPRSKSLAARSWLHIGMPIALTRAEADCDIVILKRGLDPQPGPEIINAPGHVGFYAGQIVDRVMLLAGNQGDQVSIEAFPITSILGIRRLI